MIERCFAQDGLLAQAITHFAPRESQRQMARAVAETIETTSSLLVEAGTGTGKTFAYLVPALLSGKRVIISTGSKALQEQLFGRDLPLLLSVLSYPHQIALLKGRANYLCLYRLDNFLQTSHTQEAELLVDLVKIKQFSLTTSSGDMAEVQGIAEQAAILPHITSTNDNCLGRDCPRYEECFLVQARRKAMDAQLVVINHHLFFADLVVKDTGFAELLPDAEVYIFDEAHQLPDIASGYFGESISSRQLLDLAQELILAYKTEVQDMKQLALAAESLETSCRELRLAFGVEPTRGNLRELVGQLHFERILLRLKDAMTLCYEVAKLGLGRGERIDHCYERIAELQNALRRLTHIEQHDAAYWFETSRIHFSLHLTPLSIAARFCSEVVRPGSSWIFTSATMTVDQDFSHFSQRLGLDKSRSLILDSPFAYEEQSLLLVPRGLPDTAYQQRASLLARELVSLINKVPGGIFFLCTSHQSVRQVAEVFRAELGRELLVQGDDNKQKLLAQFTEHGRAVLVATASFWEGVDVRGAALSCVIIDKLPFSAPDEPLLKARMDACRERGGDPFTELQLPEAVITLKQGVGRLIRDGKDKGILVLCDPRLVNRPYGATFLHSLPPMPRTRDISQVNAFWQRMTEPLLPIEE